MDDGGADLFRHGFGQNAGSLLHFRDVVGLGGFPLPIPPFQLTSQIGFLASQVAKAHRVRVDAVQAGQHFDDVQAEVVPLGLRHRFRNFHVVGHGALDVAHDVEGGAIHGLIRA